MGLFSLPPHRQKAEGKAWRSPILASTKWFLAHARTERVNGRLGPAAAALREAAGQRKRLMKKAAL